MPASNQYSCPDPLIAWVPCTCYRDGKTGAPPKWMRKHLKRGYWYMQKGSEKQRIRKGAQFLSWSKSACPHPYMVQMMDYLVHPFQDSTQGYTKKYLHGTGYEWPEFKKKLALNWDTDEIKTDKLQTYISISTSLLSMKGELHIMELNALGRHEMYIKHREKAEVKKVKQYGVDKELIVELSWNGLSIYQTSENSVTKKRIWRADRRFVQQRYKRDGCLLWGLIAEPDGSTVLIDEPLFYPMNELTIAFDQLDFEVLNRRIDITEVSSELKRMLPLFQTALALWNRLPLYQLPPEVIFQCMTLLPTRFGKLLKDYSEFQKGLRDFFDDTGIICSFHPPKEDDYWTVSFIATQPVDSSFLEVFSWGQKIEKLLNAQGIPFVHNTMSSQFE